jgi:nitrous oxide reductase accessory protein NosL
MKNPIFLLETNTPLTRRGTKVKWRAFACYFLMLVFCLHGASCGPKPGPVAADATSGVCPVCKMNVQAEDPWAAEIYYTGGVKLMFESPGDLITFYQSPMQYKVPDSQRARANIEKIVFKDYQTKESVDGIQAKLVYKSQVVGPMGPDFLPFGSQQEAEAFVAKSGGSIIALSEVTPEMVRTLRKK